MITTMVKYWQFYDSSPAETGGGKEIQEAFFCPPLFRLKLLFFSDTVVTKVIVRQESVGRASLVERQLSRFYTLLYFRHE